MTEDEIERELSRYEQYDTDVLPIRPRKGDQKKERLTLELADTTDSDLGFQTTYQPGRYEEGWLLSSLSTFYQQNLIDDVLGQVKGGKEASVYRCRAHPATGQSLLAAKVYRPREFRNLRNDKMYREGRPTLTAGGTVAKKSDHRLMRALDKKTEFGMQVRHTSWLMYEYTTLERLYQAGVAVPRPFAAGENAILMAYEGDTDRAAPPLSEVKLDSDEARALFAETMGHIERMLQMDLVHGDLSAFNILYWEGKITLIDFPQVIDLHTNRNARFILQRDITRVCEYFLRQGVPCVPAVLAETLWQRYARPDPDAFVPPQ